MRRGLLVLAAVAAALVAAPSGAQAAGGPKARADAKRLTTLYVKFSRGMERRARPIVRELDADAKSCEAMRAEAPEDQLFDRLVSVYLRNVISRADAPLARAQRRLYGFSTRERTVRRVARAIAHSTELLRVLGERPPQLCPYLEAWRASGWAADFRIDPPLRNYTAEEQALMERDARVIRRGLKRLRALGVPRRHIAKLHDDYVVGELYGSLAL